MRTPTLVGLILAAGMTFNTSAHSLINDRGQLIDSPRNLQLVQCGKLAKQAVRQGFRQIAEPATKFTPAERKAGCDGTELHDADFGVDDTPWMRGLNRKGIYRQCGENGGNCVWRGTR